ncbi:MULTISPECIES: GNAT family N-acetyltransferase [Clostridium]|uniref:GNAT family N-acetyltransferase n=1 Tax=Clostridium TaxID=1485 RepID=UPI001157A62C|nr:MULTISPECIES: N-acetyltransferase [Clostridium]MBS5307597.1 N-acetyltransferase [Clostridium sp.]MDB1931831.1 N-acetyltransferase [Clostridium tertium]MDB1935455.1 N-acetyltransferase [Clostridium tertium]MDB1945545.1 N-acetyltransferase [Clostridium tertium]MDB1951262.1 N-acetyltransferase [Clostridium tertium]
MIIIIREETNKDNEEVEKLIEESFKSAEFTDNDEHNLVKRLRRSDEFIKELSLLAEIDNKIVGHILLTKALIKGENKDIETLVLAPLAVLPDYQSNGIGKNLMNEAIEKSKKLGYKSIVVLGHENYYPKFGFKKASNYGIKAPFDVPDEAYMVLELTSNALNEVNGVVEYSKAFFE